MKIKLLVVPSIIALIIGLSIWFVYPAYSNGETGVMDNYAKLKAEQTKLDSVRGKSGNVSKFVSKLDAISADKDSLYEFIPTEMKESEIVDNLNKMAADSGLLVFGITLNQPKKELADESAPTASGSQDPTAQSMAALPTAKNFETDLEISGSYGQIKDFLNKVNGFSRYNSISKLSLKKQNVSAMNMGGTAVSGNSQAATSNTLQASIVLEFDILKKAVLSDNNVDDPVFLGENLDTKIISKIKDQHNIGALPLDIGQKGKSDIFMP